jgi:Tol biopolymer transport system component
MRLRFWRWLPIALLCGACSPGGSGGGGGGGGGLALLPISNAPELVYSRSRPGAEHADSQVRTLDADGLGEKRIIDQNGQERRPRLAPDGVRIAFARQRRSNDPTSQELFVATIDGSAAEIRLTNDRATDDAPTWSPDGARLAFVSDRDGARDGLFTMATDGTDIRAVPLDRAADPDWSAATDAIAVSRIGALGLREIWTIRPNGSDPRRLTDGGAASTTGFGDLEPSWSADGRTIYFARLRADGTASVFTVDVASTAVTERDTRLPDARRPRLSPRGDRMFFVAADPSTGVDVLRLHQANADGSEARLLIPEDRFDVTGFDFWPAIRPLRTGTLERRPVRLDRARVSNLIGRRVRGFFDFVLDDDGALLGIETVKQGDLMVGGLELTLPLGDGGRDFVALEVTVEAGVTVPDATSRLRVTIADYVAQRHATMVLARRTSEALGVFRFEILATRCTDRRGDARVSIVAEKDENTLGELRIDHVAIAVLRFPGN